MEVMQLASFKPLLAKIRYYVFVLGFMCCNLSMYNIPNDRKLGL